MEETRKRNFSNVGDSEGGNDSPGKRYIRGKEPLLKLLVPNVIAGHIIGKGGSYLAELKSKYGGHIRLSGNHEFYPGTDERVICLTGKVSEITDLCTYIMDKVLNTEHGEPLRNNRGDKTLIVVTHKGAGLCIGKGGATMKELRETTGVRCGIADSLGAHVNGDRVLTMSGSMEQRQEACAQIIDLIAAEETNMANTTVRYNGEFTQRSGGFGGSNMSLSSSVSRHGSSVASSNHGDSSLVGMIENIAASLDKGQIIAALTGISSNQGPTSKPSPHTGLELKSKAEVKLEVPKDMVGHLLGKAGSTIKEMIAKSHGARFDFEEKDRSDPSPIRTLTITGNFDQVQSAYHIVHEKAEEYQPKQQPQQQQQQQTPYQQQQHQQHYHQQEQLKSDQYY